MQMSFPRLLAVLAAASLPAVALASSQASDNAGNYTSWTNGSNQGTGFGAWILTNNDAGGGNAPFAGQFLGNSTAGSGNINSQSGNSFGMYANPAGASADATRSFTGGVLSIGQTFSLQLAVNFRNGNKGFDLRAGGTTVFNFNIGGDQYTANFGGTGTPLLGGAYQPDSVFTLSFTQTNATTMAVSITRTSAAGGTENAYSQNLAISGVDGFHLYVNGTDAGGAPQNNLYANNFAVSAIPEPSTMALLGAGCLAGVAAIRRRRSA